MPIAQKSPNCSFPSSPSSDAYLPSSFISGTWNGIQWVNEWHLLDIVRWTQSSKTRTGPRLNITTRRPLPSTLIMATPTTNSLLSQRTPFSESEMCRYRQAKGVGLYQYIRALACYQPFPTARRNLIVQFQRNQVDYKEYMERRKQKKGSTPRRQLLKVWNEENERESVGLFNCVHGAATTVLYQ